MSMHDPKRQRGIALVLSLAILTLMTAIVVDTNDRAHQKMLQAARQRDAAKAYYLANSGVNLYLLILQVGSMLQRVLPPEIQGMLGGGNISEALWRSVPFIDTGFLRMVMSGAHEDLTEEELSQAIQQGEVDPSMISARRAKDLQETRENDSLLRRDFLAFDGDFRAELLADEGGFNVNLLTSFDRAGQPLEMNPAARALWGLFKRPEYKYLFRDELKMDPWELVANIKDWADPDQEMSGPWGGDEDKLYDDRDFPYKPKNAAFLTHRELQLVAGMTDRAYGMFGPALKTWGNQVNVNAASPTVLSSVLAGFMRGGITEQVHGDITATLKQLEINRLGMPYGSVQQFLSAFETEYERQTQTPRATIWEGTGRADLQSLLTTQAQFFTVRSTGFVGESERTIEMSFRFQGRELSILQWQEY